MHDIVASGSALFAFQSNLGQEDNQYRCLMRDIVVTNRTS